MSGYQYGLLEETSSGAPAQSSSISVSARTPAPRVAVKVGAGAQTVVVAKTPLPRASAVVNAAISNTLTIGARTPAPRAVVLVALPDALTLKATTPLPTARVLAAIPDSIAVRATTPPPRTIILLGRGTVSGGGTGSGSGAGSGSGSGTGTGVGSGGVPALPTTPSSGVGSISDMVWRLQMALPRRWFPDVAPVLTGLLTGIASVWSWAYGLLAYVMLQRRIKTATDSNIDLISQDFFAGALPRKQGEPDNSFRQRILIRLFQEKATRAGMASAITALTGYPPTIFEPANPYDAGGWGSAGMTAGTGVGYNVAGGWGDLNLPFQAFITVHRPGGGNVPGVQGYADSTVPASKQPQAVGGYGVGAIEYAFYAPSDFAVSDAEIYQTIHDVAPAATIMWTAITNGIPVAHP